jgi:hypothetical protein
MGDFIKFPFMETYQILDLSHNSYIFAHVPI